jgi:cytochrome c
MFLYIHRHSSQAMGRSFALLAVFWGSLMASGWSHAQMELAKDKHCLSCHAMDKKVVGPSYLDVAAKYSKDTTAKERLAQKIMKGGSGVWGVIPMPANPQVSPQEAQALAAWVLQLKAP